jgi:hypothetical protein
MTFRQRRIVEILSRIAAHPKPFHDRSRAMVRRRCVRYDFRERENPKPVAERQSGRLRCITVSPMLEGQAPADFHTGRERDAELNRAIDNPVNQIKGAMPGTSIAHKPKSCSLKCFWMPSTIASLSTRLWRLRKNSITHASEFIAANASRSSSRHRRRQPRPLVNVTKALIAA